MMKKIERVSHPSSTPPKHSHHFDFLSKAIAFLDTLAYTLLDENGLENRYTWNGVAMKTMSVDRED